MVNISVQLTGVSAKWIEDGDVTLWDLNLDIHPGQLVAVIGPVGCGKVRIVVSLFQLYSKQFNCM